MVKLRSSLLRGERIKGLVKASRAEVARGLLR